MSNGNFVHALWVILWIRFLHHIQQQQQHSASDIVSALRMLADMWACLEFHASGGVRFGVDFAPYMVTKPFASAARQIGVCVIFCPMGEEQTRAAAVLGKKAEPRHAVHPMGAGEGSGRAPKEKRQRRSNEGFGRVCSSARRVCSSARPVCSSARRDCSRFALSLLECTSLSGSAADCIARIRGVSSGTLLRAVDHLNSGDHLMSPA